jgi:Ser/Thr protein kinase RdoA (MazF antagonist)
VAPVRPTDLDQAALRAIAARYDVGPLLRGERLDVRGHNGGFYRIETPAAHYFLKAYRYFDANADRGLDLLLFLQARGYPVARVVATRAGALHFRRKGIVLALFEYVDIPEASSPLAPEQVYAMGAVLARLHTLARDVPMPGGGVDEHWMCRRAAELRVSVAGSAAADRALCFLIGMVPALALPPGQLLTTCHQEFLRQHVRFRGNELAAVFDWDQAGRDYAFRDLSCAMTETARGGETDFAHLAALLRG